MEHKPLSDLSNVADLVPETPKASLTRREPTGAVDPGADREPGRALNTLHQIDTSHWMPGARISGPTRPCLWPSCPDPLLADGLDGPAGGCVDYFELSDEEAHRGFFCVFLS